MGPVLSAIGIGMLANQPTYREMAAQFVGGLPLIYFSGVLTLIAGLVSSMSTMPGRPTGAARSRQRAGVTDLRRRVPNHRAAFSSFVAGVIIANAGFFAGPASFCSRSAASSLFKGYARKGNHADLHFSCETDRAGDGAGRRELARQRGRVPQDGAGISAQPGAHIFLRHDPDAGRACDRAHA